MVVILKPVSYIEEVCKVFTFPFQCADSFLFVYTFLPMRFVLALWALISRPFRECFG